jgi:hypothetical protein
MGICMYLKQSDMSCGIYTLSGFAYDVSFDKNRTNKAYNDTMKLGGRKAMIIASLNQHQKSSVEFLITKGFRMVDSWKSNPNTGNNIILLVKFMDTKKTKATKYVLERV